MMRNERAVTVETGLHFDCSISHIGQLICYSRPLQSPRMVHGCQVGPSLRLPVLSTSSTCKCGPKDCTCPFNTQHPVSSSREYSNPQSAEMEPRPKFAPAGSGLQLQDLMQAPTSRPPTCCDVASHCVTEFQDQRAGLFVVGW